MMDLLDILEILNILGKLRKLVIIRVRKTFDLSSEPKFGFGTFQTHIFKYMVNFTAKPYN